MPDLLRRSSSWLELGLWWSLAAVAFYLTFEFADSKGSYAWGAASWPRAIIGLIVVVASVQFLLRMVHRRVARAAPPPHTDADRQRRRNAVITLLTTAAVPLVFTYLLPRTGFYVTTPVFLVTYLMLLGERRLRYLIGVPALIYALVLLVFVKLFYVALPTGNWAGFYDFSNWLIQIVR